MTEHITDQIDTEAGTIIDLTTDESREPAEHSAAGQSGAEPEATIDLTADLSSEPVGAVDDEPTAAKETADDTVEQAAELIEQIDAEAQASAEPTDQVDDIDELAVEVAEPPAEEAATAIDVPLRRVLEAVLLIAEDPLPVVEIAARLEVPAPEVETAIHELAAEYEQQERGFALREIAGGWRYYTAAECAPEVERFLLAGQTSRLSQAALETLAVVAYQQPVSRSRIAAVRGVSVDGVMKTLVSRGLVAESGQDTESGAIMYVTTPKFLERIGLRDLSELPPLAPLLPGLDELPEE